MKLRRKFLTLALVLFLCLPIAFPRAATAQVTRAWSGDCVYNAGGDVGKVATINGFECLVTNILNIGVSGVGIAAFVMFIIGSMMYLTSGGDPRKTEIGSKTMTYAFFGILVSVSGWVIINFMSTFTGVETFKTFQLSASPTP